MMHPVPNPAFNLWFGPCSVEVRKDSPRRICTQSLCFLAWVDFVYYEFPMSLIFWTSEGQCPKLKAPNAFPFCGWCELSQLVGKPELPFGGVMVCPAWNPRWPLESGFYCPFMGYPVGSCPSVTEIIGAAGHVFGRVLLGMFFGDKLQAITLIEAPFQVLLHTCSLDSLENRTLDAPNGGPFPEML